MMRRLALTAALVAAAAGVALAQMDPRMVAGLSVPAADLPAGALTVRVVKEQIANNLPGVRVELHGAGPVKSATTGEDGRAEFRDLPIGARLHAVAVVDGERLESREVEIPSVGGLRIILVAGIGAGSPAAGASPPATVVPPDGGALVLGNNTRIAVEFQEDVPTFFYLLEIVNRTSAPVALDSALVFDMPAGAVGTTVLEGGSPMANARGDRVTVSGPFPPGITEVPIAFRIESSGATLSIEQRFPLPLDQVAVAVQRVGDLRIESPQAPRVRDASFQNAQFLIAHGPALGADAPLELRLTGLPHHSRTPLYVALTIAAIIAGVAIWLSASPAAGDLARRQELERRRERGLASLAALEAERRQGRIADAQYEARRGRLVQQLERIYGALDVDGALGAGGGQAR